MSLWAIADLLSRQSSLNIKPCGCRFYFFFFLLEETTTKHYSCHSPIKTISSGSSFTLSTYLCLLSNLKKLAQNLSCIFCLGRYCLGDRRGSHHVLLYSWAANRGVQGMKVIHLLQNKMCSTALAHAVLVSLCISHACLAEKLSVNSVRLTPTYSYRIVDTDEF